MKNISKLELALLPLIIISIMIMIGAIGFLCYMTWFLLPLHWSLKLLISIILIYILYLGYIIEPERKNIQYYNEQLKKLKETK